MSAQLGALIYPPTRLSIVALLATADEVDCTFVRDSVGVSDAVLFKLASA